MSKIAGSGSINQRQGSADSDPHQNAMDPDKHFTSMRIRAEVFHYIKVIEILPLSICDYNLSVFKREVETTQDRQ
jgi:hypothetical protein